MDEILLYLPPEARVLDLGSGSGSFPARSSRTTRTDCLCPPIIQGGEFVQANADRLPFRGDCFDAIICNHSLEHVDDLAGVLAEIGRVVRGDGSLFVSVPDASTLTDRLYRWLFHEGQHVNAFTSAPELAGRITEATGLPLVATLVLHSSLSFLQRSRFHPRPPRRMWLIGNGDSRIIAAITFFLRIIDRMFLTRTTVYGWAFYFGRIPAVVERREWRNVCVGCGVGFAEVYLRAYTQVHSTLGFLKSYDCPQCGVWNLLTKDVTTASIRSD